MKQEQQLGAADDEIMTSDLRGDSELKEDLRKPKIKIKSKDLEAIPQNVQDEAGASAANSLGKQADQRMSRKESVVSSAKASFRENQSKQASPIPSLPPTPTMIERQ